jgi:hypothetical protein
MPLWKPLLIVLPAAIGLGIVGSHFARPVMVQRSSADPAQAMLQTRSDGDGLAVAYPDPSAGGSSYVGGYSYPPGEGAPDAGWAPPHEYVYTDGPLPSLDELDARQAALLADPDVEFAVAPPATLEQAPPDGRAGEAGRPESLVVAALETAPEPRKADGEPAIW